MQSLKSRIITNPAETRLNDIDDLDEFIRSGFRVSSVRASKEERNVSLSAG